MSMMQIFLPLSWAVPLDFIRGGTNHYCKAEIIANLFLSFDEYTLIYSLKTKISACFEFYLIILCRHPRKHHELLPPWAAMTPMLLPICYTGTLRKGCGRNITYLYYNDGYGLSGR
jgi:hypothetical protein